MSQPSYLQLEGVAKQFGSFTALQGVDLQSPQGEFVCCLGPSGCGKTTLLRIIAGLEAQSAGRILQAGRDISTLPPAQQRGLAAARWPEKADKLALRNLQVHALQRGEAAELLGNEIGRASCRERV